MHKIDDWLIDSVLQPFAHWFQKLTGKTNFFLARAAAIASTCLHGLWEQNLHGGINVCIGSIFLFCLGMYVVRTFEQAFYRQQKSGSMFCNPTRISHHHQSTRGLLNYLFLGLSTTLPFVAEQLYYLHSSMFFWILMNYFCCLTPLPPGESKFKKWATSIGTKLRSLVTGLGNPQPAGA